ncbi:MAG TPA: DUF2339 domain-containing protein, partial [Candidatus Udaeobacter sp.]|nr:DUF2339 domain-containing protein [Candidatus Udaeobacter sp.]
MELLVLFGIGLLIAIVVLPFVALAKANSAKRGVDDLATRLSSLENQVRSLGRQPTAAPTPEAAVAAPKAFGVPQPLPITTPSVVVQEEKSVPPPIPKRFVEGTVAQITRPPRPPINWEQFMGAKLFAWIGGLALFLGVAFFVKYSFEHNLISPELRIAIGFVVGTILVIGGLLLKRKENAVTAQTLCATGILVLYAVTFACRAYYHFAFFGLIPTFLLMTLITANAFLLAVRLNAMVVA